MKSIINSIERLIYDDVSDLIEKNDSKVSERYVHIKDELFMMQNLAVRLSKIRHDRGSLDFDLDEAYITLDESGIPVNVGIAEREARIK